MKRSKKIAMIVAVVSIFTGILISFLGGVAMGFDFRLMNSLKFVTNTYQVEEQFTDISVTGAECEIRLLPSEDGSCKVVCSESDKIYHNVVVKDDKLSVERIDGRAWYDHIGIYWGKMEITVYLPESDYGKLYVKSLSGNIEIPSNFSFISADIDNTSGEVSFTAAVENDLSVKTVSGELYVGNTEPVSLSVQSTSGNVKVDTVKVENELSVKTVSGDILLSNVECNNLSAKSTSGEIGLCNVFSEMHFDIESVSGDIDLSASDAGSLRIKTTSGDVHGDLLTEKVFITDTQSGDVNVPSSGNGGKCEIKTTSGDIRVSAKNK